MELKMMNTTIEKTINVTVKIMNEIAKTMSTIVDMTNVT